ncbi:hypothetical protein EDD37DRAFT_646604 [Exophiala viscosa]|uniref:Cytochrome b mRNA-processing protein 4 n=1 Tax=Exophiala viscosa TaxID=2486360 RepID=A0AAN6E443_9EURO|nr:hypothetical protein EDD36DRAFT_479682 [Exophiala viscosa]KAI1626909.1 hypothetical protein EDD37DRAFT_646604 [Exophiala viscosa]
MAGIFVVFSLGGPALMYYVTPAEGEVFKKFNPELQARNLALKDERMKNYEAFLQELKELSKSDKNMWVAAKEKQKKMQEQFLENEAQEKALQQKMREEMKAEARGMRDQMRTEARGV